jgi:hypothetical protein
MTGLTIDSSLGGWGAVVAQALRQIAPRLSLDASNVAARTQPHLRILSVGVETDSAAVEAVWAWCFASGGGESGWPVRYSLKHAAAGWHVVNAQVILVGHGRQCAYGG